MEVMRMTIILLNEESTTLMSVKLYMIRHYHKKCSFTFNNFHILRFVLFSYMREEGREGKKCL